MTTISAESATNTNGSNGHALAIWEPRRALTLDAARRHSTFIRYARLALIGFSGLLALLLLWYFINVPKPPQQPDNPDESVKFINPIYKGRTTDGLPYRISADEAVRFIQTPDDTKLLHPVLNFLRARGTKESVVLALSGLYNADTQELELRQDVHLQTDDGYDCKTSHARIFVKGKRIEGDEAIDCTGNFGSAQGNAYEINDNYTEFVFKGGMTAVIIQEKTKSNPELRGGQE